MAKLGAFGEGMGARTVARLRRDAAAWLTAGGIGVAAGIAFLLFSWLSLAVPRATILSRVESDAKVLLDGRAPLNVPALNTAGLKQAGFFSSNDCMIYGMMVLPYADRFAEIVSPRIVDKTPRLTRLATEDRPYTCIGLVRYVDGTLSERDVSPIYYHRYVAAYRPAMRLLAWLLPLSVGALALFAVNAGLLGWVAASAGRRMRRAATAADRRRARAFAIVAGAFLLLFGLQIYGQYPSYALADMVDFLFLLAAWRWPLCRLSEARFVALTACFGAATAGFEFLTGGIPLGLALVLGLTALGQPADRATLLRRAVLGVTAYALAIACCIATHYVAVAGVFGFGEIGDYVHALGNRLGTGFTAEMSQSQLDKNSGFGLFDLKEIETNRLLAMAYLPVRLLWGSRALTWGYWPAAVVLDLASLGIVAWRLSRGLRRISPEEKAMCAVLAGSMLAILLWYVVFLNHSILHMWMARLFVWFYALAGILMLAPPQYADPPSQKAP